MGLVRVNPMRDYTAFIGTMDWKYTLKPSLSECSWMSAIWSPMLLAAFFQPQLLMNRVKVGEEGQIEPSLELH